MILGLNELEATRFCRLCFCLDEAFTGSILNLVEEILNHTLDGILFNRSRFTTSKNGLQRVQKAMAERAKILFF